MVTRDYDFETFVLEGEKFKIKSNQWIDRFEKYLDTLK
jgi:hypothetical protein